MGATYWARWTSREPAQQLRNLLLPLALAEGYDLLTWQNNWQMFDRGGVMQKLAWSLNGGGRWSDSPTVLTISYASARAGTVVTFRWSLSVKPLPTGPQKASFEHWVRTQMERMIQGLCRQVDADAPLPDDDSLEHSEQLSVTDDAVSLRIGASRAATVVRDARAGTIHYAGACFDDPPVCRHCDHPALPIPGAPGRYYCLNCRRPISRQPVA